MCTLHLLRGAMSQRRTFWQAGSGVARFASFSTLIDEVDHENERNEARAAGKPTTLCAFARRDAAGCHPRREARARNGGAGHQELRAGFARGLSTVTGVGPTARDRRKCDAYGSLAVIFTSRAFARGNVGPTTSPQTGCHKWATNPHARSDCRPASAN